MTIKVGQQVFFHPLKSIVHHSLPHGKILAATVAAVLEDGRLNLGVLDINGAGHSMTAVPLLTVSDTAPERGYYATETAEPAKEAPKSAEDVPLSAAATPAA